jgi:ribosome maturation factor RimP
MGELEKFINEDIKGLNLSVDSISYDKNNLNIILDSDEIISIDKIVQASKIINKILDEKDIIKERYILDVSSKERGVL